MTPSRASADWPRANIARESARCASIGCSAPSIPQSSRRASATDTGAVLSAISRAISLAAATTWSFGWRLRTSPPSSASCAEKTRPVDDPLHRLADADQPRQEPARRRLGHDAAAREDEAELRVVGADADVHRQRHRHADADGRPVDRGDHRLERLEDLERHAAAAVAVDAVGRLVVLVRVEGVAAAAEVGARAEAAALAGDDRDAHVVVGVDGGEGGQQLVHHRLGERVEPVRSVQRDGRDAVVDGVADLLEVHGRAGYCVSSSTARHNVDALGVASRASTGRSASRAARGRARARRSAAAGSRAAASQTAVSAPWSRSRRIGFVSLWKRASDSSRPGVSAQPGCVEATVTPVPAQPLGPQLGEDDLHALRARVGGGAVEVALLVLEVARVELLRVHAAARHEDHASVAVGLERGQQQLRQQVRAEDVRGEA